VGKEFGNKVIGFIACLPSCSFSGGMNKLDNPLSSHQYSVHKALVHQEVGGGKDSANIRISPLSQFGKQRALACKYDDYGGVL